MATLPYQPAEDASPARPSPHLRRLIVGTLIGVAAAIAIGVSSCSYWFLGVGQRSRVSEYPDALQIIARPGEAWLFLDIEKAVKEPGAIAGAPRSSVIQQLAIVFDGHGVKKQIPITTATRFETFNKNIAIVFALDDGIYLLDRPSLLFRWNTDHFEPVREGSRESFAKVPALAEAPDYQEDEVLDAASVRHGWKPVARDSFFLDDVKFEWDGGKYLLDTDATVAPAKVRLRRVDRGHEWSADIAAFNAKSRPARRGE